MGTDTLEPDPVTETPEKAQSEGPTTPIVTDALTLVNEMLQSTTHRNIYDADKLAEFMADDLFNDVSHVIDEYRNVDRGPSFNDFVPSGIVMDLCLDLRNALSATADR